MRAVGGAMRNKLGLALFIAVSACLLMAKPGIDVNGTWTGEVRGQEGGTGKVRFVLLQEGDRISGTTGPLETSDGDGLPRDQYGRLVHGSSCPEAFHRSR